MLYFELFVRRKERILLIEKIGEKIDPSFLEIGKVTCSPPFQMPGCRFRLVP